MRMGDHMRKKAYEPLRGKFGVADVIIYVVIALLIIITIYPIWYTIVVSFSTETAYYSDPMHIIPRSFTLSTYDYVLHSPEIIRSFFVSVVVTVLGIILSMILSCMAAYVLSRKNLPGRKGMFMFVLLTMYLSGGITPWYIVVKSLGLYNTIFAFFIPTAINTFNVILIKNYFESLPDSINESAEIDGANDFVILAKIMIPVSLPIVATVILFYAVFFWNDWFSANMFTNKIDLYPMALVLKNMITSNANYMAAGLERKLPNMIKSAVIILNILPIMMVYPFVQKYFVHGIMLGSVKE